MAGKPQTLATTSAFEILGPVMVGPSSSHTAGALRCAQVAASLLEGDIKHVTFTLWNSFAHTYRGHGTDRALVAGILGLDTDDERIRDAFDLARERGLGYEFDIAGDDGSLHPNTVDISMVNEAGATAQVRGESLGGGKMRITRINGRRRHLRAVLHAVHRPSRRTRRFGGAREPPCIRPRQYRLLSHLPHRAGRTGLYGIRDRRGARRIGSAARPSTRPRRLCYVHRAAGLVIIPRTRRLGSRTVR